MRNPYLETIKMRIYSQELVMEFGQLNQQYQYLARVFRHLSTEAVDKIS